MTRRGAEARARCRVGCVARRLGSPIDPAAHRSPPPDARGRAHRGGRGSAGGADRRWPPGGRRRSSGCYAASPVPWRRRTPVPSTRPLRARAGGRSLWWVGGVAVVTDGASLLADDGTTAGDELAVRGRPPRARDRRPGLRRRRRGRGHRDDRAAPTSMPSCSASPRRREHPVPRRADRRAARRRGRTPRCAARSWPPSTPRSSIRTNRDELPSRPACHTRQLGPGGIRSPPERGRGVSRVAQSFQMRAS